MDLSTGRLEASSKIQEGPFSKSQEERRQRPPRRLKEEPAAAEAGEEAEGPESHQLDDIA